MSHVLPIIQRQLSDNKKSDVSRALKLFKEGDSVRARILAVDVEKRRVNLGLKRSYFANDLAAITAASDSVYEQAEDDGRSSHGSDPAADGEDRASQDDGNDDGDWMEDDQDDVLSIHTASGENAESEDTDSDGDV